MEHHSEGVQILTAAIVGADGEFEEGKEGGLHRFKLLSQVVAHSWTVGVVLQEAAKLRSAVLGSELVHVVGFEISIVSFEPFQLLSRAFQMLLQSQFFEFEFVKV